jgi:hypothetical protein
MEPLRELIEPAPTAGVERHAEGAVRYCSVEIGPEGVAELDDRGRVVFVAREKIRRVVLRKGIAAERPWVHVVFGCLCFGVAILAGVIVARWSSQGGTLYAETMSGFAMVPLGIGIFWALFRSRHFLRVESACDARHMIFRGRIEPQDLRQFLAQAEATQGIVIEREVPAFERASPYRE